MFLARCSVVFAVFALLAFLLAGLHVVAGEKTSSVSGRITLDGKPLAGGTIILYEARGDQFVGTKIKEDGRFEIDRVLVGKHKVAIESKGVPERYGSKSALEVEVIEGANQLDFELRSK